MLGASKCQVAAAGVLSSLVAKVSGPLTLEYRTLVHAEQTDTVQVYKSCKLREMRWCPDDPDAISVFALTVLFFMYAV